MSSVASLSGSVANFNTGLGKYDGSLLYGVSVAQDISGAAVGSSDLNLTSGYVVNPNTFVLPTAISGASAGFTIAGWFNTSNTNTKATIVDLSCTSPSTGNIVVNISGGILYGNYPGAIVFPALGSVSSGAWNFFAYSVCASGGTQLLQTMYLNGVASSMTGVGGTYTAYTVSNMFVGYGAAPYTQFLNGKVDDFRYYGRVLTPMEIRVLNQYSYSGGSVGGLVPTLGSTPTFTGFTTVANSLSTTTPAISFALANTGTFSSLKIGRYLNGVFNTNYIASAAVVPQIGGIVTSTSLVANGNSFSWSDVCYNTANALAYSYTFSPVIMGSYGAASPMISFNASVAGVSTTNVTAYIVDLSFSGLYSYVNIQRSMGGATATTIATNVTGNTYRDTSANGLATGTSYTYYVIPYNAVNVSGTSASVPATTLATTVSSANLLVFYKFDLADLSGNKVYNYATSTYDMTVPGGSSTAITSSTFVLGTGSLYANTSVQNQYYYIGSAVTYAFWFKTNMNYANMLGFTSDLFIGTNNGTGFGNNNADSYFTVRLGGVLTWPVNVFDNTWRHVCCTSSGGYVTLYINGIDVTSQCTGTRSGYLPADLYLYLGKLYNSGIEWCWIDDFRLYSRVLNPAEALVLYSMKG